MRIPLYREIKNAHTNAHYYVDTELLRRILIKEEQVELDHYISKYNDTTPNSQSQEMAYYVHNSIYISSRDIRIPKCELDSLFQEDISNNITDKPFYDEELSPKDSAYHLIAVLKDLLLDPDINAYHFKTYDTKSTNQPTQTGLAEHIDSMNIKGLKARNINGIFSVANKMFTDLKKD